MTPSILPFSSSKPLVAYPIDLVKLIVKDSPSRAILNTFCSQIGGSIARYNSMAAYAWVQNYIRSSHISVGEVAV